MDFPTRYVKLAEARRRHGDRVERFGRFLLLGDPLADAVVDALSPLARAEREALVDRALDEGIARVPEAPDALRALFAHVDHVPLWVDFERCDRGAKAFMESGILGGLVLGALSLVAGYCSPAGNKPLMFSGRLEQDVPRRLAETSRFVEAVATPGSLRRHGQGFRACVKVRLVHAAVRRMLLRSPRWSTRDWGVPINQADSSGTLLLFSYMVLQGLDRLGHVMPPAGREDFLHLWRYAGWVLGVDPELLCATSAEAESLWDLLASTQDPPDDDARALAKALMESAVIGARDVHEREAAERRVPFGYALSRYLIGDEYADHLGFPRSPWRFAFPVLRAFNAGVAAPARSLGPIEQLAVDAGRRHWRMVTETALRGVPAAFSMPDRLRV